MNMTRQSTRRHMSAHNDLYSTPQEPQAPLYRLFDLQELTMLTLLRGKQFCLPMPCPN